MATFKFIIEKREHYEALHEVSHFLDQDDPDLPYEHVVEVKPGRTWRMNTPTGVSLVAKCYGHTFNWSHDFGNSYCESYLHEFDPDNIEKLYDKLPSKAKNQLVYVIKKSFIGPVSGMTKEIENNLHTQKKTESALHKVLKKIG